MTKMESIIRAAAPGQLDSGSHRERLARRIAERCRLAIAPWSSERYQVALVATILCFCLSIAMQPKAKDINSWTEQRAILATLVPATPIEASPAAVAPPVAVTRAEASDPVQVQASFRASRAALADVMAELKTGAR